MGCLGENAWPNWMWAGEVTVIGAGVGDMTFVTKSGPIYGHI